MLILLYYTTVGEFTTGNMSVTALQRLYLRLKRNVFSRSGVLQKGNSRQLEWYLSKQLKGTMDEKSYPRCFLQSLGFLHFIYGLQSSGISSRTKFLWNKAGLF